MLLLNLNKDRKKEEHKFMGYNKNVKEVLDSIKIEIENLPKETDFEINVILDESIVENGNG